MKFLQILPITKNRGYSITVWKLENGGYLLESYNKKNTFIGYSKAQAIKLFTAKK
jgi:hypothetical protein